MTGILQQSSGMQQYVDPQVVNPNRDCTPTEPVRRAELRTRMELSPWPNLRLVLADLCAPGMR